MISHIFALLLAPFVSKLVNNSRHSWAFKHTFKNSKTAIFSFEKVRFIDLQAIFQMLPVIRIIDKFVRKRFYGVHSMSVLISKTHFQSIIK